MNRDEEHLQLLAIFHYVVAGFAALFSFFRCSTQRLTPSLYLLRGTVRRNLAKTCRLNFLAGFLLRSARCFS